MHTPRAPRRTRLATVALSVCLGLVVAACGEPTGPRSDASASRPPTAAQGSVRPGGSPTDSASATRGDRGGPSGSSAPPYVPAGSRDTLDKRLGVTLDGTTIYIRNGGQVVFDDGLVAEFSIDPYPPATLSSTIDVYLTRDGEALPDGGVEIAYEMLAMGHGPFSAEAKNIGGGHYLLALDYIMFGPWEQVITLRIGLQRIRLTILVVAYPGPP